MDCNRIVVLGTGGTIAGTATDASDNVGYRAGQVAVERLVAGLAGLEGVPVTCEQVAQVDSKDMTPAIWLALAGRCRHWAAQPDVRGIVVTHGTDTLEETAYFLHRTLDIAKPVVLTCAMRPASSLAPDGPQNLLDAIAVARTPHALGVLAVCAGVVHDPVQVTKVHPYRLDPFRSPDAGPLGYVEEGRLRRVKAWVPPQPLGVRWPPAEAWPLVEIVTSHAGGSGVVVDALSAAGVDGIVVAGTGNGTVHEGLARALHDAREAGVRVVLATRCAEGPIVAHAEHEFPAAPVSPVKARIDLAGEILRSTALPGRAR